MGASGAVQILHGKRLAGIPYEEKRRAEHAELVREYGDRFATPLPAAERGYVDEVIAPTDTRRALGAALGRLGTKHESASSRRHSNSPL